MSCGRALMVSSHRSHTRFVRSIPRYSVHFYWCCKWALAFTFLKDLIYLLLERGAGREKERERSISVWERLVASHKVPNQGPGLEPRHVPWLGIEPAAFQFTGQRSVHWATPTRAHTFIFLVSYLWYIGKLFRFACCSLDFGLSHLTELSYYCQ